MCRFLKIARSTYYYEAKRLDHQQEEMIELAVIEEFKKNKENYGTRKIKKNLNDRNIIVSRRKFGRIMRKHGLVSSYAIAQFKVYKTPVNEDTTKNHLNQKFNKKQHMEVLVSDLTYVRVNGKWNYLCVIIDLFNREIVGHAAGRFNQLNL